MNVNKLEIPIELMSVKQIKDKSGNHIKFTMSMKVCYSLIKSMIDANGEWQTSYQNIADHVGMKARQVQDNIKTLDECGLVEFKKTENNRTTYTRVNCVSGCYENP